MLLAGKGHIGFEPSTSLVDAKDEVDMCSSPEDTAGGSTAEGDSSVDSPTSDRGRNICTRSPRTADILLQRHFIELLTNR